FAALVVAEPLVFVNTARYRLPCTLAVTLTSRLGPFSPLSAFQVLDPFVRTCHWIVGAGSPVAAAVSFAVLPRATVFEAGCLVTRGAAPVSGTEPSPWSATKDATCESAAFQFTVISFEAQDWMWSR